MEKQKKDKGGAEGGRKGGRKAKKKEKSKRGIRAKRRKEDKMQTQEDAKTLD